MRCLGIDFGSKRVGISISDKTNILARSYDVLSFSSDEDLLNKIKKIVLKEDITHIVMGLPKNMNNTIGDSAKRVLDFEEMLKSNLNQEIILYDERLSTKEATNMLVDFDISRKKRKKIVDKVAATIILQNYLDKRSKDEK